VAYITLFDNGQFLGDYDLPEVVTGNESFRLVYAFPGGGNGVVFDARRLDRDGRQAERCAVKFLRQRDQARLDRFNNEIRIMKTLNHPKIARFYDCGEVALDAETTVPWIAMELGGDNLRRHIQSKGSLDIGRVVWVGTEICEAIQHLHDHSLIHRDIKPENFVWELDDTRHIKMIDFGIAKRIDEDMSGRPLDSFTKHMEFVGPVFFSSPELIAYASNKAHPVEYRSDLFQLGKLLWFIATGIISAGSPSKKACPVGGKLRDLVLALVDDDPDSRPSSAREVASMLQSI
jgi:serine/threonine-protein kinase